MVEAGPINLNSSNAGSDQRTREREVDQAQVLAPEPKVLDEKKSTQRQAGQSAYFRAGQPSSNNAAALFNKQSVARSRIPETPINQVDYKDGKVVNPFVGSKEVQGGYDVDKYPDGLKAKSNEVKLEFDKSKGMVSITDCSDGVCAASSEKFSKTKTAYKDALQSEFERSSKNKEENPVAEKQPKLAQDDKANSELKKDEVGNKSDSDSENSKKVEDGNKSDVDSENFKEAQKKSSSGDPHGDLIKAGKYNYDSSSKELKFSNGEVIDMSNSQNRKAFSDLIDKIEAKGGSGVKGEPGAEGDPGLKGEPGAKGDVNKLTDEKPDISGEIDANLKQKLDALGIPENERGKWAQGGILTFSTQDCSQCPKGQEKQRLAQLSQANGKAYKLLVFNSYKYPTSEQNGLAGLFGVNGYPTTISFDAAGNVSQVASGRGHTLGIR